MPLPSSPRSHSTATQSDSLHSSIESLTTPRPGSRSTESGTASGLGRSRVTPYFGREPPRAGNDTDEPDDHALREATDSLLKDAEGRRAHWAATTALAASAESGGSLRPPSDKRSDDASFDVRPDSPRAGVRFSSPFAGRPLERPVVGRRISFTPGTSQPRPGIHSTYSSNSMRRRSSPHAIPASRRKSLQADDGDVESSADENTAIVRKAKGGYGTATGGVQEHRGARPDSDEDEAEDDVGEIIKRKKSSSLSRAEGRTGGRGRAQQINGAHDASSDDDVDDDDDDGGLERENWLKRFAEKYGSIELENKGSVARDHLALERTFLAWLRTSLSFASIGIAITQLFRLSTSLENKSSPDDGSNNRMLIVSLDLNNQAAKHYETLRQVGKPLGATFIGVSILILLIGFHRYFESQHYVIRGKFPASRGSVALVSIVTAALIITSLVVVVTVARGAIET